MLDSSSPHIAAPLGYAQRPYKASSQDAAGTSNLGDMTRAWLDGKKEMAG
jgi:hypothetical protein